MCTKNSPNPKLVDVSFNPETDYRMVEVGWATKPKWGEAQVSNTVGEFKEQIMEWFEIGSHEPAKKVSASRMQRLLQGMYPNRKEMSMEQQVQAGVTALAGGEKKQKRKAVGTRCNESNDNKAANNTAVRKEVDGATRTTRANSTGTSKVVMNSNSTVHKGSGAVVSGLDCGRNTGGMDHVMEEDRFEPEKTLG